MTKEEGKTPFKINVLKMPDSFGELKKYSGLFTINVYGQNLRPAADHWSQNTCLLLLL